MKSHEDVRNRCTSVPLAEPLQVPGYNASFHFIYRFIYSLLIGCASYLVTGRALSSLDGPSRSSVSGG